MPKPLTDNPIISPWDRPGVMARARALHTEGASRTMIAAYLNAEFHLKLTASAVSGKFGRLGIRSEIPAKPIRDKVSTKPAPPSWTSEEIKTMINLKNLGADALSRLINRSAKAIYRKASDMGIKLGGPKLGNDARPKPRPTPLPYMQPVGPIPDCVILACEYPNAVPLMQIGRYQCREIIGDAPEWHMCGSPVEEGLSWCPVHARKNLTSMAPKEDRSLRRALIYHGNQGSQPRAY